MYLSLVAYSMISWPSVILKQDTDLLLLKNVLLKIK